ncbi:MAG: Na+/H+ antiporter subunit E [Acetobacteraceae bacterium]|nr:Na+/H+ antiporter subunit E [Acetobacteraceae bacterium]
MADSGSAGFWLRLVTVRWAVLLLTWIVIAGASRPALPAGVIAAGVAAWVSVLVQPPRKQPVSPVPLLQLGGRLLAQSVVAGWDIARRAFDPALPLNPGLIRFPSRLAPGPAQAAYSTIVSMVPGTLPLGPAPDGSLLVHCLDTTLPVAAGLARDEALWVRALGGARTDV